MEEERRKDQEKSKWRSQNDISSSDEEVTKEKKIDEESNSDDESSSEEDDDVCFYSYVWNSTTLFLSYWHCVLSNFLQQKAKGVQSLIEIENPNRVQKKNKKLATLNNDLVSSAPQLSRREREEIEKQKAKAHYQKLHAEGKTDQAKADLARLAIIKQQREEARLRREKEIKGLFLLFKNVYLTNNFIFR